jgi:hypothetical protein
MFYSSFCDISACSMLLQPAQFVFVRFGGFIAGFVVFSTGSLCFSTSRKEEVCANPYGSSRREEAF